MDQKEILQWAIKGITAEMAKKEKNLKRDLLLMQAYRNGIVNQNFEPNKTQKRINSTRADLDELLRKKGVMIAELEGE